MKRIITCLILLVVLSACSDPLGMTTREQSHSAAQQAQWDSQARQAEAQAAVAESQAKADVEKTQIEAWTNALQKVEDASKRNMGIVYLLILAVVRLGRNGDLLDGAHQYRDGSTERHTTPTTERRTTYCTPGTTEACTPNSMGNAGFWSMMMGWFVNNRSY